jgi:hypothetical protein
MKEISSNAMSSSCLSSPRTSAIGLGWGSGVVVAWFIAYIRRLDPSHR